MPESLKRLTGFCAYVVKTAICLVPAFEEERFEKTVYAEYNNKQRQWKEKNIYIKKKKGSFIVKKEKKKKVI